VCRCIVPGIVVFTRSRCLVSECESRVPLGAAHVAWRKLSVWVGVSEWKLSQQALRERASSSNSQTRREWGGVNQWRAILWSTSFTYTYYFNTSVQSSAYSGTNNFYNATLRKHGFYSTSSVTSGGCQYVSCLYFIIIQCINHIYIII
jgi:hypothetical protein